MRDLDEIRTRLGALEDEVTRLRDDAAATRTLAALADRDASEVRSALRAHTPALSALRETQVEQSRTLETIAQAVGTVVAEQGQQRETLAELTSLVRRLTERDA
ncbi:MAG TPA: hypothetical protein VI248_12340 [Kineosporiaceae bacterium]